MTSAPPTAFQPDPDVIRWRLHLLSPPSAVYAALATDAGRAGFWAESAESHPPNHIRFTFPNGYTWSGRVLAAEPDRRFAVEYIGGSRVDFLLADDGRGGTDLLLTDRGVPAAHRAEVTAGWVSVLLALKAFVDFGVDLRAHDPARQWDTGYAAN